MKYKTGTFNLIPNKEYLRGKPAEMQSIYFWIVDHANKDGQCFPGRNTIAKESGCGVRTVDKYLKQLEEEGFITKNKRFKKDTKELSSNMYQLLLIEDTEEVLPFLPSGLTQNDTTGLTQKSTVTIPNELYPLTTPEKPPKVAEKPFHFEEEMQKLLESKWKPNRVRWLYFTKKKFRFENHAQMKTALQRNLRPAQALEGYDSDQVEKAIEYCEENYANIPWSLETILKVIPNVVNKRD